jgi:hypothetical protein
MTMNEILTTYWSQTTLILAFIGYFLKRFFDNKSKKREINHTLFQKHRINSINEFYDAYAINKRMWYEIPIYDIMNHKTDTEKIDNLILPSLNDLRKSVVKLQIYFEKKDFQTMQLVLDNIDLINNRLMEIFFEIEKTPSAIVDVNQYQYLRDEKMDENEEIFEKINMILRKTYK